MPRPRERTSLWLWLKNNHVSAKTKNDDIWPASGRKHAQAGSRLIDIYTYICYVCVCVSTYARHLYVYIHRCLQLTFVLSIGASRLQVRKILRIWQRHRQRQRYRHMAGPILLRV